MAARSSKTTLHEKWREKIAASMLLNRLANHALGKCEMTSTQVRAAEVLLKKVMPDLSATDLSGELNVNSYSEVLNAARKLKSGG